MKNRIHYEDDLFYLTLFIKGLREGFRLSLDPDFFLDKILEDLRFLDGTLGRFFSTLKENTHLIQRAEYFHNLVKVEVSFRDLLNEILNLSFPFCESLVPYFDEWKSRRDAHDADVAEIRTLLKVLSQEEEKGDVITAVELDLLTRPVDTEEDN